jgi:putative membrane protein
MKTTLAPSSPEVAAAARWSPVRVGAAAALGLWAALFWFLLLTGRSGLYLSTRTDWLVPVGAVILTAAAIGRLASARTTHRDVLTHREAWTLGAIAAPAVLLLALPPITLGTYSVDRRSSFAGSGIGATARAVTGELDFVDVGAAQSFDAALQQLTERGGEPITLEGIVTEGEGLPADELLLARYIVTCCVADATVARVRVVGVPPGVYEADDWIRVEGRVYPVGREVLVAAESIEEIAIPDRPYLTP